jgi:hypothetical protein
LIALALLLPTGPAVAKKRKPCPDAAYVVQDAPIIPGDTSLQHNGLLVSAGKLSVGGSCPPVKVKQKASKKGTKLSARFKSCTGLQGPVVFKGMVNAACTSLTGKLAGKKAQLTKDVAATAVPSGTVSGLVRIARVVPVPEDTRSEMLAQAAQLAALGVTVRDDGSALVYPSVGAAGWRVTIGDVETNTNADGAFTVTLDTPGATEGVLYHPAQDTDAAVVFWLVPHLAGGGGTPTPVDIELQMQGPCGMNEAPAVNPPYCASLSPLARALEELRVHPAVTFVWNLGPLGSYPSLTPTGCRDQDGGFGLSGTTTLGVLTNYVGSTCDTQVTLGCCENELGSIKVSIKSAFGKLTGFKPVSCQPNHKGRFCDDVLHDDVGAQVPAGIVNASHVFTFPKSVTQPVAPNVPVTVTVHNNACYGETVVTKTVNDLGGTLAPLTGGKVLHYTTGPGGRFTYMADVPLTYTPPNCPVGKPNPVDTYNFEAGGASVDVSFQMPCSVTSTTTVTGGGTTTTVQVGRAVHLLYSTGGVPAGSDLCLSRVGGGHVVAAHAPFCLTSHLHAQLGTITIDGSGSYVDPDLDDRMQPCGFGEVLPSVSGCGPDSVP